MATDTSTPCPVTPSNGGPYGEPTTTDHTPQQIGRPKFDPNHDAALKNALLLAQEVVSDKRNCRAPREIPTDDAINMAILITDMVRMLNASNVVSWFQPILCRKHAEQIKGKQLHCPCHCLYGGS